MEEKDGILAKSLLSIRKDTFIYIPGKLIPILVGFISLYIYTRIFSAKDFGDYSIIMTTVAIVSIFTYGWLDNSYLRLFAIYEKKQKIELLFTTSILILVFFLFISSISLFILKELSILFETISSHILLFVCFLASSSFFNIFTAILRANRKAKAISFLLSSLSIFSLVNSLLLIYLLNFGINAILISYVFNYSILSVIIFFKFKFYNHLSLSFFSKETAKELFNYGLPLIITLFSSWILIMSDRYMIAYFRGNYEVGIYSAVYQLVDSPMSMISTLIMMAAFPIIIDTWEKNGDQITIELISKTSRCYLLLAIPSLFGIISLSSEIMILLGQSYSSGYVVLPWICFGSLLSGLCFYTNKGIELYKKTKILACIIFISSISNIFVNFLFIPQYGYYGAAISTALSYTIYFVLSYMISKRYIKWRVPISSIFRILVSSIVMSFSLSILKMYLRNSIANLTLLIIFGLLIYIISLALTGEIKTEIKIIQKHLIKFSF